MGFEGKMCGATGAERRNWKRKKTKALASATS